MIEARDYRRPEDRYKFMAENKLFDLTDLYNFSEKLKKEKLELFKFIQLTSKCNRYNFDRFCREYIVPFLKKHREKP